MPSSPTWTTAPAASATTTTTSTVPQPLTLRAPPGTDIWRPRRHEEVFNAPHVTTRLLLPGPSSASIKSPAATIDVFRRVRVTVAARWKTLYDQGGVVIFWPPPPPSSSSSAPTPEASGGSWIKAGIEHVDGEPALSVVGCDRLSDWSLNPLPAGSKGPAGGLVRATFEMERDHETMWVYFVPADGGPRTPLRDLRWAAPEDGPREVCVGVYAAKPTPDADNAAAELEVVFEDLLVEVEGEDGKAVVVVGN